MVVLANQLVQLVVHVTADVSTVLFDLGDVSYRIIDIAVGGVVAVGYRIDQMGACIGSTALPGGVDRRTALEDFTKLSEVHRGYCLPLPR